MILRLCGANPLYPKLLTAIVLLHETAYLYYAAYLRRRNRAVPHLAVDLARAVGQVHIKIAASVAAGSLIAGAHQQKALKAHILHQLADGIGFHQE